MIEIEYKKLNKNAAAPIRIHEFDAGYDLTALWKKDTDKYTEYGTGIGFQIPIGYVGLLFPRSSVTNMDLMMKNAVGVIDSGYIGEVKFRFIKAHHDMILDSGNVQTLDHELSQIYGTGADWIGNQVLNRAPSYYEVNNRVGQIIFFKLPEVTLKEIDILTPTERGTKGYGDSGK